ncbi:hypothetical protein GQX73_g5172 [Xylaria multiplex]|uniref:EF-hand domain-containing protein n=1 Tax=Xylaria multiplex TaxID=323545 RepID=A0A7C8MSJ6_9PEZI|nr:hypothetical protein GQX73_g5172 [Xylaria multiplex]
MKFSIFFTALLAGAVTAAPSGIFVDCPTQADKDSADATGLRCKTFPGDDNTNTNTDADTDTNTGNNNSGNNGNNNNNNANSGGLPLFPSGQGDDSTNDIISQLQSAFDRNNPNGTPTTPGDPDDLNGDGVINLFEAGAQAS